LAQYRIDRLHLRPFRLLIPHAQFICEASLDQSFELKPGTALLGMASPFNVLNDIPNSEGDAFWTLMFPEAQHGPTEMLHRTVSISITCFVRCPFSEPVISVCLWRNVVRRTPMPVAAIDEYDDLRPGECDVGTPSPVEGEWPINSVTQPLPVEQAPHGDLRRRIATFVRLHGPAST
jgi:hypothetical protein